MTVSSAGTIAVADAFLIEPPLGSVKVEVSEETVLMRFEDGEIEAFPRSAVRALDRDDFQVTVHWAGTPVVLAFDTLGGSAKVFDELGGFDSSDRTFTFLLDDPDMGARKLGLDPTVTRPEPKRSPMKAAAVGTLGLLAMLAAFAAAGMLGA